MASRLERRLLGTPRTLHLHGGGSSLVGGYGPGATDPPLPEGSIRVAWVPMGVVKFAKASSPAIPGTAATAPCTSPRRSACAALARGIFPLGRSLES